jgi:hypothetical protein
MRLQLHQCGYAPEPARHGTARHGTARHGTARHGTARHGTARVKQATVPMAAVVLPWYCELHAVSRGCIARRSSAVAASCEQSRIGAYWRHS